MKTTKNMRTRSRQLAILAKRLKWGSEEQIEAVDELCGLAEQLHDERKGDGFDFQDIVMGADCGFRMTTDELVDFALQIIESAERH